MKFISIVFVITTVTAAGSAVGQVLTPREAFGGASPSTAGPRLYPTPMSPSYGHDVNCSPNRASMIFASAIRTGAARVWTVSSGRDTYAVIWRRGQSSYRAVQLIENKYGRVGQKPVGKTLYRTSEEATDAIAQHVEQHGDAPLRFRVAVR